MRRFIIDTDTGSDDAAALMTAVLSEEAEILGITTVAGNVGMEQAGQNALMTLEVCGSELPVYPGAGKPLLCERKETLSVHGADGMGGCDLIHPERKMETERAADFILDMAARYPGELEIIALGPVTNIALALLLDRDKMKGVRRIWSMGTAGFGMGNATPTAEFNVFIDPHSYAIMLESGIPVTIIGFDCCTPEAALKPKELSELAAGGTAARFLERATSKLREFDLQVRGEDLVDLPDALAVSCALWEDVVKETVPCYAVCCTDPGAAYGQVVFYPKGVVYESMPQIPQYHVTVVRRMDEKRYMERFMGLFRNRNLSNR